MPQIPVSETSPPVSLFTREWIEIHLFLEIQFQHIVSLFTREWIEMSSSTVRSSG